MTVLLLTLTPLRPAHAACANPAANEGAVVYNQSVKVVQFCDGTNWIAMGGGGGGGSTTLAGLTDVDVSGAADGKVLTYSTSSGKWEAADASGGATPAGSVAGAVQFRGATAVLAADDANLVWDNTNKRLGIGTASPARSLHVGTAASDTFVRISTDASHAAQLELMRGSTGTYVGPSSGNTFDLWSYENIPLKIGLNNAEVMRVLASGNVGIGTTDAFVPTTGRTYLSIKGSTEGGALELASGAADTDPATVGIIQFSNPNFTPMTTTKTRVAAIAVRSTGPTAGDRGGTIEFHTKPDAGVLTQRMVIDRDGNVGIGTTAPQASLDTGGGLHVRGTQYATSGSAVEIQKIDASLGTISMIADGSTRAFGEMRMYGTPVSLWPAGAPALTAVAGGNVGIGTTTPADALHIIGTYRAEWDTGTSSLRLPELYLRRLSSGVFDGSALTIDIGQGQGLTNLVGGAMVDTTGAGYHYLGTRGASRLALGDGTMTLMVGGTPGVADTPVTWITSLFIDTLGHVGIGNTAPVSALDVTGGVRVGADATCTAAKAGMLAWNSNALQICLSSGSWGALSSTTGAGSSGAAGFVQLSDGAGGFTHDNTALNQFFWDSTNHRLGLGTVAPSAKLHVYSNANNTFKLGFNSTGASNVTNSLAQVLGSLDAFAYDASSTAHVGASAYNLYNDGNSPSWSSAYLYYAGTSYAGNLWGVTAANQGALVFQNVANGVIASNGADIKVAPNSSVSTTFTAAGNVGIGTASPAAKLNIYNDAAAPRILLNTAQNIQMMYSTDRSGVIGWSFGQDASDSNKFKIANWYDNLQTNTRLTIDTGGNVGIGTTAPDANARLQVMGRGTGQDGFLTYKSTGDWQGIHLDNTNIADNTVGVLKNNDGSFHIHRWGQGDILYANSAGSVTSLMLGNVGIGTTAPTGKLQIAGSHAAGIMSDGSDRPSVGITGVYPQLVLMSGNSGNGNHGATIMLGGYDAAASGAHKHWSIGTAGAGSTFLDIGYHAGTSLNPHSGIRNYDGTTMMTILNSGNVGIGTLGPSVKLDVAGAIRSTGDIAVTNSTPEGGRLRVLNSSKTGNTTNDWSIWNMTGGYGNALKFWRYNADGSNPGPSLTLWDSGPVEASSDFRAPIFYDLNDTGYYLDPNYISYLNDIRPNIMYDRQDTSFYVDPNGSTRLNGLTTTSFIYENNNNPTIVLQDTDHRNVALHNNSSHFYILSGNGVNGTSWTINGGAWPLDINLDNDSAVFGGDVTLAEGNLYAPFWYDSNNTGYYVNPDGDSNMLRVWTPDLRASIWYDRDDGNYYVDPNGTSRINNLIIGNDQWHSTVDGKGRVLYGTNGSNHYKVGGNGSWFVFRNSDDTDKVYISGANGDIWMSWLGDWISTRIGQDVRYNSQPHFARIYDDDTNYYFDANTTSKIHSLQFPDGTVQTTSGGIPSGAIMAFDLASCPSGWSEYTAARGVFLRGIDNGAGMDPSGTRSPGAYQADAVQDHQHYMTGQSAGQDNVLGFQDTNLDGRFMSAGAGARGDVYIYVGNMKSGNISSETRPRNVAVLYCRKN